MPIFVEICLSYFFCANNLQLRVSKALSAFSFFRKKLTKFLQLPKQSVTMYPRGYIILEFLSANGAFTASDITVTVLLSAFTVACFIALIVFLCRFTDYSGAGKSCLATLLLLLGVGLALRLVVGLCIRGYRGDYALYANMFDYLKVNGVKGYYKGDSSSVMYPIVYFIYLIFGGLSNAMGLSEHELGMQFMVKLPLIVADLVSAVFVYKLAAKYWNKAVALVLTAFVAICPIFFIGSTIYNTPITFTVTFIVMACYYLAKKNYAATIALSTAAAFSSREGIYIFPIVAVFSVFHFVRAIINARKDKPSAKGMLAKDYSAAITVPVAFVGSLIVAYLLGLPMLTSYSLNPFKYIYEFLLAPLGSLKVFTLDGLSIYSVFGRNGALPDARFPAWLFACVFGVIVTAVVCIVYFTKRNRAMLVMLIGFALLTMQLYYPDTYGAGMQSVLLILVAAYALVRDKRILTVMFVVGLCYVVNSLCTVANMGHLNNLSDYVLNDGLPTTGINGVTIACSVFAVVAHVYYTVITISIGMTKQKRLLGEQTSFVGSIKDYFSFKRTESAE